MKTPRHYTTTVDRAIHQYSKTQAGRDRIVNSLASGGEPKKTAIRIVLGSITRLKAINLGHPGVRELEKTLTSLLMVV